MEIHGALIGPVCDSWPEAMVYSSGVQTRQG